VLTKLYDRSFYADELNRLERKGLAPVTIIIADLNGLKSANDQFGHAVGDALLRRAGEVLNALIEGPTTRPASAATSSRNQPAGRTARGDRQARGPRDVRSQAQALRRPGPAARSRNGGLRLRRA
jgi:diguanylate cyclase with GGDEF domain